MSPGPFPRTGLPPRVPGETPLPGRAVPEARRSGLGGSRPALGARGLIPSPTPVCPPAPSRRQKPPHGARPHPRMPRKPLNPPVPPPAPVSISPREPGGLWAPRSWGSQLEWDGEGGSAGEERRCRQTGAVLQAPGAGR